MRRCIIKYFKRKTKKAILQALIKINLWSAVNLNIHIKHSMVTIRFVDKEKHKLNPIIVNNKNIKEFLKDPISFFIMHIIEDK